MPILIQYRNCTTLVCSLTIYASRPIDASFTQAITFGFMPEKCSWKLSEFSNLAFRLYFVSTSSPVPICQLVTEINNLLNIPFGNTRNQSICKLHSINTTSSDRLKLSFQSFLFYFSNAFVFFSILFGIFIVYLISFLFIFLKNRGRFLFWGREACNPLNHPNSLFSSLLLLTYII
jgi:hypothetical protein